VSLALDPRKFCNISYNQGDQIGRIFARSAIFYFGQFFKKYTSTWTKLLGCFFQSKDYALIEQKWFWLHFGQFFLKLMVTLPIIQQPCNGIKMGYEHT
jgi:hypothetical protein